MIDPIKYYSGTVTGDGKPYDILNIPGKRLQKVQEKIAKKGAVLSVSGCDTIRPLQVLTSKKAKVTDAPESLSQRPVVCVTTSEYFESIGDAALALMISPTSLYNHIKGIGNVVKGNKFRLATEEEIELKQYLGILD